MRERKRDRGEGVDCPCVRRVLMKFAVNAGVSGVVDQIVWSEEKTPPQTNTKNSIEDGMLTQKSLHTYVLHIHAYLCHAPSHHKLLSL